MRVQTARGLPLACKRAPINKTRRNARYPRLLRAAAFSLTPYQTALVLAPIHQNRKYSERLPLLPALKVHVC